MVTPLELDRQLTSPGAPFETCRERVHGEELDVFAARQRSLRDVLASSAMFSDREYLVFDGGLRLTFGEHLRVVASVARALQELYGVEKGDRVAIWAANCPEWVVTFWAAVSLGAVPVALNGWWSGREALFGIEDSAPKVLVADAARLSRLDGASLDAPVVEVGVDFPKLWSYDLDAELPSCPLDEDDPAAILYTSGTTGRPKGVVNTHRNVVALSGVQVLHGLRVLMASPPAPGASIPAQRVQLVGNPLFHVSGLYTHVVTFLMTGSKTVWTTGRFDPVRVMELIESEGVTGWSPMGSMAVRVATHPDVAGYDLSSVLTVGSGGAPTPPAVQELLRSVFPNASSSLSIGYGQTECTALATMAWGDDLLAHPGTVGRPLPTVEVEVRSVAGGAPLPDGEEGEVCVRSPLVMSEYWRRPEETSEVFWPGRWLRTGDIGHMQDGLLFVDARARDLILRGAENVYPAEVELCLEEHPDVAEAAVLGVEHAELGQEVKAVVVPSLGVELDTGALEAWCREGLAYFKVPAHWEVRAEPLPRNAAGKVMKHVLSGESANPFVDEG